MLEASAREPWEGEIRWAIYDFRGRVLGAGNMPAKLAAEAKTFPFAWAFADHGVRVDTVWVTAAAVREGVEWARAELKLYKHERWNMRNEYQWSTWPRVAGQAPSLIPRAMRMMAYAGFNALGYSAGGQELYYPAERYSWRIYDEGIGANTWNPVIESVTDEEIEASVRTGRRRVTTAMKSGALVLTSVGEEAGLDAWHAHATFVAGKTSAATPDAPKIWKGCVVVRTALALLQLISCLKDCGKEP